MALNISFAADNPPLSVIVSIKLACVEHTLDSSLASGSSPSLIFPGGSRLGGTNVLLRYFGRIAKGFHFYGRDAFEASQIDEWLEYSPALASGPDFEIACSYLDNYLLQRTLFVGYSFSIADIAIWAGLAGTGKRWESLRKSNKYQNLVRWYNSISSEYSTVLQEAASYVVIKGSGKGTSTKSKENDLKASAYGEIVVEKGKTASRATFEVDLPEAEIGKDPIPTSLLKVSSDVVSRAGELSMNVLKYMGVDSSAGATSLDEQIELVRKLYKQALKRSVLRDVLFEQISKQTRNNCDRQWLIKAWELMYLCASCFPPSKDFGVYLSEYVNNVANGLNTDSEIKGIALNTLHALKCSIKAGPRHTIPGREEIEALLVRKRLTTIVFFLDETFEEITYDMSTTVADAVEELAGIIKLSAYSSFSLFKSLEPGNEEYIGLDDNKYIGDLPAEFKNLKDRTKGEILHCKLIFKKRLFRESDEAVAEPMFVQLSYVQVQHDYILGNYPVGREDAAQLSALQILVEIGFVDSPDTCTDWTTLLERFLSRQIAITRAKQEWEIDILSRYRSLDNLTKDDARQQFLRILRNLPYGNSVFFSVRKIDDPIGLLPERIILGINKRGVHFLRPVPKEYLHLAELCDIMEFGGSNTTVFFKMRVAGVLHKFQFETKQGDEVCVALQTHIDDVVLRRYSKAQSAASGSVNVDVSNSIKPNTLEVYKKQIQELSEVVEESKKNVDQRPREEMLNAVERRCNEAELFMKNKEELNAIIMELRKNYASAQEKVAKEESDKLAVTNRLAREKEARLSAEKLQTSLSEEVAKCQKELEASNQKFSSLNEMHKRLQEYNTSLQQYNTKLESELAAANDNLKRVEKEKAAVVENLSTARGHNKSLQDISGASS